MNVQPVPGFPGYFASVGGDVFSGWYQENINGKLKSVYANEPTTKLTPFTDAGYLFATLYRDHKYCKRPVHYWILLTFHGPRPFAKAVARHLDGNPLNNCSDNLAWGTQKENCEDAQRHGTLRFGARHTNAVLTEEMVSAARGIKGRAKRGQLEALAKTFGVLVTTLRHARNIKSTWKHVV